MKKNIFYDGGSALFAIGLIFQLCSGAKDKKESIPPRKMPQNPELKYEIIDSNHQKSLTNTWHCVTNFPTSGTRTQALTNDCRNSKSR